MDAFPAYFDIFCICSITINPTISVFYSYFFLISFHFLAIFKLSEKEKNALPYTIA